MPFGANMTSMPSRPRMGRDVKDILNLMRAKPDEYVTIPSRLLPSLELFAGLESKFPCCATLIVDGEIESSVKDVRVKG